MVCPRGRECSPCSLVAPYPHTSHLTSGLSLGTCSNGFYLISLPSVPPLERGKGLQKPQRQLWLRTARDQIGWDRPPGLDPAETVKVWSSTGQLQRVHSRPTPQPSLRAWPRSPCRLTGVLSFGAAELQVPRGGRSREEPLSHRAPGV